MYRAVVITTLVILLLAVAGVSAAQDGRIFAGGPNREDSPGSTAPEATSSGATVADDPEASALPGASSEPEDGEDTSEPTVLTELTVEETQDTEEPAANAPVAEQTRAPGSNDVAKPVGSGRGIGRPEHAGKDPNVGSPRPDVGHPANGKPEALGNEEEHGRGVGRQGTTLCHKGKDILTVGAPAVAAHLRHGDTPGGCRPDGAGPDPSGEKMGPEAEENGGNGAGEGQDKAILCHKGKNTLTVGLAAQTAHLRHGDSLGTCR